MKTIENASRLRRDCVCCEDFWDDDWLKLLWLICHLLIGLWDHSRKLGEPLQFWLQGRIYDQ